MKQFKALIIKDFNTYKKSFYMITIVFLVMYLLSVVTTFIGYSKHSANIHIFFNNLSTVNFNSFDISKASFLFNAGMATFISFFFMIFTLNLSGTALNSDYNYKCALFHRNLPISIWKISASRYIVTIFGSFLTMVVLSIFTSVLSNLMLMIVFKLSLSYSLLGLLKVLLPYFVNSLLMASIAFFFSAVFKRKAVGKGFIALLIIHFSIVYINFIFGTNIPYFLLELGKTISVHINYDTFSQLASDSFSELSSKILDSIWNIQTLLKILYSGLLFVISTLIINYKEITE